MDIGKSYKNIKAEVKTSLVKILVRFLEQLLNNKNHKMFYGILILNFFIKKLQRNILNYLSRKELIPYWVNTSSNDLIKMTLKNSTTVKEKIERLLNDEAVEVQINLETIIVGIEDKEENIWGLMLQTGYLKVVETVNISEGIYKVKIPNYEIKELFKGIVRDWFKNKVIGNDLTSILKDLIELNLKEYEKKFKVLVNEMFSYMDVGRNTAENFYHAFVLGMLVGLKDTYYVNSNRESGFGRYDIMLEPKVKNGK